MRTPGDSVSIDRSFVRVAGGEIHLRRSTRGAGRALVMIHASPGSSRNLLPLIEALARDGRRVLAADTPGNGDSDDLAPEAPDVAWYAVALVDLLDRLGVDEVDLYGTHTGARIAVEVAAQAPERVGALILDGLIDYPPETRALFLERYAPAMEPDDYGRQFAWAFNYIRDQAVHFPHFLRDPEHRIMTRAVPDAASLHASTLDLLKALTSYHKAYRAAFAYPLMERLPEVMAPTLLLRAQGELPALKAAVEAISAVLSRSSIVPVAGDAGAKAAVIGRFLALNGE